MEQLNHEKTPKKLFINGLCTKKTPISTPKNSLIKKRFLLLSNNANLTQSPSTSRIVRNPFENQLHEKLRLPVISSPSLFHAKTPKKEEENKLEIFEWTIEELSNLNPVNVIPHETQFSHEEIDPQYEEKAQAAISSFFQEQQIVPSPHACNLRKQRIQLKNDESSYIYNSTALCNNSAMISSINVKSLDEKLEVKISRDIKTQTALSLPPILPKEIEDLLKKYQQNDKDNSTDDNELNSNNQSMMDISTLRRKLFIQCPEVSENENSDESFAINVNLSPAPKTPELTLSSMMSSQSRNDAFELIDGDMFGELSPICNDSSINCSPDMSSSNDVSMISDVGRDYTPASRRRCNGKLKKKRLSESFSLLQNEQSNDKNDNFNSHDSENTKEGRLFRRFDSGFENGDSRMNYSFSAEFMQI